ncbi:hypothetical protein Dsin_023816 [Dipteronia sinensis]|uniref:Uncharacterized protein n=1 Tax=Dipteronia sinensis TaxID=43782 RepID=A0AAE0A5H9_9ROSI|nr:hypothetical protein Dsin_023816 [Dipteronia sinensis]
MEGVESDTRDVEQQVSLDVPLDVAHPDKLGLMEIRVVRAIAGPIEYLEHVEVEEASYSGRPLGILVGNNLESVLTDDDMERLKVTYGIPDFFELLAVKKHERADMAIPKWTFFYEYILRLGWRFLVHSLACRLLVYYNFAPSQLMPNSWRILLGLTILREKKELKFGLGSLLHNHFPKQHTNEKGRFTLYFRPGMRHLILDLTTNDRRWKDTFFYMGSFSRLPFWEREVRLSSFMESSWMGKSDADIKSLATCLRGKLENLSPLSEDCCIYRVPSELRYSKGSHGTPLIVSPPVVSIGPLHHGKEELKAMEEHKLRYSEQFLQRTQVSLEDFLIFIKSKEEELRNCYAETIPLASQDFVEMILLDAIFLIEFLLLFSTPKFVTSGDRIFGKPWLIIEIKYDIWSVENQIPFFILEDLFKLAKTKVPDECYDGLSISKLVSFFCGNICELLSIDESLFEINFSGAKHFVDLLRLCIEPSYHQLDIETETMHTPTLPTITELHRAGVKFEVGSNKHLFDIRFDKIKGILKIQKLRISDVSFYFKNLQMFEALHCQTNPINDYAIVISLLISSPKDAELLIQNGILENTESIAASTFCGDIGKQATWSYNKFYYIGLARDLNAYCKSPWRNWNANLKQNYFNTPWASISVFAAVLLLLLTITQTVCSIIAL